MAIANSDGDRFDRFAERVYEQQIVVDGVEPKAESERLALWSIREDFESILQTNSVFLYDVSLPILDMDEYVLRVEASLKQEWPDSICYTMGHIADGNVHFFIRPNSNQQDLQNATDLIVYTELKNYRGSVSAEHGLGRDKIKWLA